MTVRVRLTQGANEAGAACLGMVLASHGLAVGQEELRMVCGVGRDGTDLDILARAAETYGFVAEVRDVRESDVATLAGGQLPLIVSWGQANVAVIDGHRAGTWDIVNPVTGRTDMSTESLALALGPRVLAIVPGPDFRPGPRLPGILSMLASRAARTKVGIAYVVIAGLALIVPGVAAPAFVRLFVDGYLSGGETSGVSGVIGGLAVALVISVILTTLQLLGLRRLLTATVTLSAAHFVWHLIRMPAWFYSQRDATTLAYRVKLNEQLADVLSGRFTGALLAQITSAFYLVVMFVFAPGLAVIALLGLVLGAFLVGSVARTRTEVRQVQSLEGSVTATQLGVSLRLLETLKATGNEDVAFNRVFSSLGRRLTNGNTRLWGWLGMIPTLIAFLTSALVLGVGALLVIRGSLTVGTLAAFTILLSGLLAPLAVLVPSVDSVFNLKGALEQLNDVLEQSVDVSLWDPGADGPRPVPEAVAEAPPVGEVGPGLDEADGVASRPAELPPEGLDDALVALTTGSRRHHRRLAVDPWAAALDLRGITFGYSPTAPPLLSDVSLSVSPGKIVAIVGSSGSGKTTVGRLVAGLYQPWAGDVLLDGRPLVDYPSAERARLVSFVDQDVVLYQASVRANVTMFDPLIPDRQVVAAARDAQVHDEIIARPGGYDAWIAEDGRDLSGGQRQRLVIARALVRQPRLLVLDEATSSLDARTEARVVAHLRSRGCTALVIAHRLSTVRDADEIIVLHEGQVAERGTHHQLAGGHGLYRELMDA